MDLVENLLFNKGKIKVHTGVSENLVALLINNVNNLVLRRTYNCY